MTLLIRKSWIVFVYAVTISLESIIIEYLTTSFVHFSSIMLSAISITFAGILLLIVIVCVLKRAKKLLVLFSKSWKNVILASLSLSFGIFTWYDSINKIGASKEVLIAGPLEIVIIVILARAFLREKLTRFHFIGIGIALVGFFLAVASDIPLTVPDNTETSTTVTSAVAKSSSLSAIVIGFGDVEAILSAFGFAGGVIVLTKLAIKYSSIEVAGASMFTSGLILVGFMVVGLMSYGTSQALFQSKEISFLRQPLINSLAVLLLFSLLPFIGSLSYSTGLSRIGASLTSTLGSSSILMTVVLQIILKEFGINSHLPENIFLAILGGVTGFLGIYVIHIPNHSMSIAKQE